MTTKQLKQEEVKAPDQMPDEILAELLEYMKSLQGKDEASVLRAKQVRRIFDEDRALLKTPAQ